MACNKCDKALGFWTIGMQYIQLSKNIVRETIEQKNKFIIVSAAIDCPVDPSWDKYNEETRWSDHNIIVPSLFVLLHGFELMLKGYIIADGNEPGNKHKLSDLLSMFNEKHANTKLSNVFSKYIKQDRLPALLSEFCSESNITMDDYYQALKYPESVRGDQFKHYPLKYKDKEGLPFFESLLADLLELPREAVALSRRICPDI